MIHSVNVGEVCRHLDEGEDLCQLPMDTSSISFRCCSVSHLFRLEGLAIVYHRDFACYLRYVC